jgi:hypothetical protein
VRYMYCPAWAFPFSCSAWLCLAGGFWVLHALAWVPRLALWGFWVLARPFLARSEGEKVEVSFRHGKDTLALYYTTLHRLFCSLFLNLTKSYDMIVFMS